MKKIFYIFFFIFIAIGIKISTPWDKVDIKTNKLEELKAPKLYSQIAKNKYIINEAMEVRFILENPHDDDDIVILPEFIFEVLKYPNILSINILNKDLKEIQPYYLTESEYIMKYYLRIKPKESLLSDQIIFYQINKEEEYILKSNYQWRGPKSLNPFDKGSIANAEDKRFAVYAPTGVDKDALNFIESDKKLIAMQDASNWLTSKDIKENQNKNREEMRKAFINKKEEIIEARKQFLNKFPDSTYSKNILLALAKSLKYDKKYSEAINYYEKYVKLYPQSWFVDNALFDIAECQIELGLLIEAKATVDKILHMQTDASIYFNATRIKANLEKGYTTLDQIYSH